MRIWVDCTAAAHPLVLRPIIERLRDRGHEVEITAREYGQTIGILERLGLPYEVVGAPRRRRDGGQGAGARPAQPRARSLGAPPGLRPRARPRLGRPRGGRHRCCGSRSVQMQDYEYAGLQRQLAFRAARRVLVPDAIPVEAMRRAGAARRKLFRYPGLKEDYYLADFVPDTGGPRASSGSNRERVLGGRPPAARDLRLSRRQPDLRAVLDRLAADASRRSPS